MSKIISLLLFMFVFSLFIFVCSKLLLLRIPSSKSELSIFGKVVIFKNLSMLCTVSHTGVANVKLLEEESI